MDGLFYISYLVNNEIKNNVVCKIIEQTEEYVKIEINGDLIIKIKKNNILNITKI